MGREVTKGIVDIEGDRSQKIRTIAAMYGARPAAYASAAFYISAVILSIFPWAWKLVSFSYIPPIILTDVGFIAISILILLDHSRENARKIKNWALICMIAGLLSFTFGIIA